MPTLAYIAGFFDGEGCVGIARRGKSHTLYATIGQNKPEVLRGIQALFGGSIRRNKSTWIYWTSARIAYRLLFAIHPYLIVKKHEVAMALEAFHPVSFAKNKGVPQPIHDLRERNMKGIAALRKIVITDYSNNMLH